MLLEVTFGLTMPLTVYETVYVWVPVTVLFASPIRSAVVPYDGDSVTNVDGAPVELVMLTKWYV
jgi:hypothetical protein